MPQNDSITAMKPWASTWKALATRRKFHPATKLGVLQLARGEGQAGANEHDDERHHADAEAPDRGRADPAELAVIAADVGEESCLDVRVHGGPIRAQLRGWRRAIERERRGLLRRVELRVAPDRCLRRLEECAVPRPVGKPDEGVAGHRNREQQQRGQHVGTDEPGTGGWLSLAHTSAPAPARRLVGHRRGPGAPASCCVRTCHRAHTYQLSGALLDCQASWLRPATSL